MRRHRWLSLACLTIGTALCRNTACHAVASEVAEKRPGDLGSLVVGFDVRNLFQG
jgi:hypothetical protein